MKLYSQFGHRWSIIPKKIVGRTDVAIKYLYNKLARKEVIQKEKSFSNSSIIIKKVVFFKR
jgi:hypothetical protein